MIHCQGNLRRRGAVPLVLLLLVALASSTTVACQRDRIEPVAVAASFPASVEPRDGSADVASTTPLRVAFAGSVDRQAVERSISVEPATDGTVEWEANSLTFRPRAGWRLDTRYRVTFSVVSQDGRQEDRWETSFATAAPPRVIRFAPTGGDSPARTDSAVAFEFTRTVDESSFLDHLTTEPDINGKVVRAGNVISYLPTERLKTGTKYTVVLRPGVRDERGLETTGETRFQFTTVESPRVLSVTPGKDSTNSSASGTRVVVEFDRPMNRASVESSFSLYPPVRGTTTWEGNKLVFKPESLSPATRYTVRVVAGAVRDEDDNYLLESLLSDFATAGQVAVVSAPQPSPTRVSLTTSATATPAAVAAAVRGPEPAAPAPAMAPPPLPTATAVPPATATLVPPATATARTPATAVPPATATAVPPATSTPVPPATATPPPPSTPTPVTVNDLLAAMEYEVLIGHNGQRAAAGLAPLTLDPRLVEIARYRSADMARRAYFSHTAPDGSTAFTIMDGRGIRYAWAGENLALNDREGRASVETAMQGWMGSAGHRANILNPRFNFVGVGMATNTKGVKYYTVIFLAP